MCASRWGDEESLEIYILCVAFTIWKQLTLAEISKITYLHWKVKIIRGKEWKKEKKVDCLFLSLSNTCLLHFQFMSPFSQRITFKRTNLEEVLEIFHRQLTPYTYFVSNIYVCIFFFDSIIQPFAESCIEYKHEIYLIFFFFAQY